MAPRVFGCVENKLRRPVGNVDPLRLLGSAVLFAGMLAGVGTAQTSTTDAQVEANVLKALAGAPQLASEQITTRTAEGVVTLSGTVRTEQARTQAEQLAANTNGVVKVVDELRLGSGSPGAATSPAEASPLVLLSDGTYGPAPGSDGQVIAQAAPQSTTPLPSGNDPVQQRNNPDADHQLDLEIEKQQNAARGQSTPVAPGAQQGGQAYHGNFPSPSNQSAGAPYPTQYPNGQYPPAQYPEDQSQAGGVQTAPPAGYPYPRQPMYYPGYQQPYHPPYGQYSQQGGQVAGQQVVIPNGALLRVRVNQTLRSDKTQPGTTFDGIVVNDVAANGVIAIPRGAAVQGTVIDAKGSGALTGRGEMSIQLTSVLLGGQNYPLVTNVWTHNGGDKTIETVNKTAGFGAAGAVIGALAGGGVGAAIGGGVGAAAGLGSSAASGHGQVVIPSEAIVTFHTSQPTTVATVSQQEMQRLAYGVPPGADMRPVPRAYPPVYVAPGYYPGYYPYRPYGPYGPYY